MKRKFIFVFFIILLYFSVNSTSVYSSEEFEYLDVLSESNYYQKKEENNLLKNNSVKLFAIRNNPKLEIKNWIKEESKTNIKANIQTISSFKGRLFNIKEYELYVDNIKDLLFDIYDDPEMFYICGITAKYETETNLVTDIVLQYYIEDDNQIKIEFEKIDEETEKFLSGVDSDFSDFEKVLYTHDYICKLANYNYDEYNNFLNDSTNINWRTHKLNGALIDHVPVCDGYSKAVLYLLNKLDVYSSLVTSDSMAHAWNIVCLDGYYYHVDSTWDDQNMRGRTSYKYFLMSDIAANNKEHTDYSAKEYCENTKYDDSQVWNKTLSYLVYNNDYWYYLTPINTNNNLSLYTSSIELNKYDFRNNKLVSTKTITDSILSNKINLSPILTADNNKFIFNGTNAIYTMDFNGENVHEFYKPKFDNILYSVEYFNDVYYYNYLEKKEENTYSVLENTYVPIENIELEEYIELTIGTDYILKPTIVPTTYDGMISFNWEVEDPKILTVNENGKIQPLKEGETNVKITYGEHTDTCRVCIKPMSDNRVLDGLILNESDGYYYYYENNILRNDFTGCLEIDDETVLYVIDGCVTYEYTWLKKINDKWTMIINNKLEPKYTGFGTNENGTWYLQNGEITYCYNRLMKINGKWTMVKANRVEPKYTGFGTNENGTWYLQNGEITYCYNRLMKINGKWTMVKANKVEPKYTGFGTNENGTWYLQNGEITYCYNRLMKINGKWTMVKANKVEPKYTGFGTNENGTWYLQNGEITYKYNRLMKINGKWTMVKANKVEPKYTGFGTNENGTWYLQNGEITYKYNRLMKINGKWTMVKENKVEPKYTGFGTNENGTWYLQNGEITYCYNRLMKINGKWTMVKANKVEPKYTGLGTNENGTWYLQNGEITYQYNGIYVDNNGKRYVIRNNKVI